MFTGLVQDVGTVTELRRGSDSARIAVRTALPPAELPIGASIAVDGCCLTVVSLAGDVFHADASTETLARTTLGALAAGGRVNLELPLRLGDRLGGHLVLGHVDGVGRISLRADAGPAVRIAFDAPDALLPLLIEKGSVAVDGISLTVNQLLPRGFEVMLIPETLRKTGLGQKAPGARVNLEMDVLGKYVARLLGQKTGVTEDLLKKAGFIA